MIRIASSSSTTEDEESPAGSTSIPSTTGRLNETPPAAQPHAPPHLPRDGPDGPDSEEDQTLPLLSGARARMWAWTSFEEVPPPWDPDLMKYYLVGKETCPDTGRHHHQGFTVFKNQMRFSTLHRLPGWERVHLEQCRGTSEQNCEYCKKEGDWMEFGTCPPGQGKRTDLVALAAEVSSGTLSVADVALENPHAYHVFGRTLNFIADVRLSELRRGDWAPPHIEWMWGDSGSGKSRAAHQAMREICENEKLRSYKHSFNDKGWWDLYNCEEVVLFDDFKGQITFGDLLVLLDGYETRVPRRGRAPIPVMFKYVFITSFLHPREIYHSDTVKESIEQLLRRVDKITHFTKM